MTENPIDRQHDPDAFSVSASMHEPANRQIRIKIPLDALPGEWYPMTAKRADSIGSLLVGVEREGRTYLNDSDAAKVVCEDHALAERAGLGAVDDARGVIRETVNVADLDGGLTDEATEIYQKTSQPCQ